MSERVTRRGIIQKFFIDGVDAAGRLLSNGAGGNGDCSRILSPEEAGLMLSSRKTGKKGFHLNKTTSETSPFESNKTHLEDSASLTPSSAEPSAGEKK